MMKIIIAGSRSFRNYSVLEKVLNHLFQNLDSSKIEIVSGGARGADRLGERYAREHGLKLTRFPANWEAEGRRAGYIRNRRMAQYADALVAFWDSESPGTRHMIKIAREHGLKVRVVRIKAASS